MNPTSILCWALAYSAVASLILLATAGWVYRLQYAAVRHLAWVCVFAGIAFLPLVPVAKWVVKKNAGASRTQECPPTGANADVGRDCVSGLATGVFQYPLSSLALGVWFTGTAWTVGRAILALRTVHRWQGRSREYRLPSSLPTDSFREVTVRIASEAVPWVPITSGFRRPYVLLPRSAERWDESRLTAIFWHELGHIRRGDNLSQLFTLLVCALQWFNPIFWFAARRMEAEAEIAADDFAILRGVKPSRYAAELLAVASELRSRAWKFPMAHTAMVKAFTLEDRLRSVIDPKSRRGAAPARAYGKLAGAFVGSFIILIVLTPRLATWLEPSSERATPLCPTPAVANG